MTVAFVNNWNIGEKLPKILESHSLFPVNNATLQKCASLESYLPCFKLCSSCLNPPLIRTKYRYAYFTICSYVPLFLYF